MERRHGRETARRQGGETARRQTMPLRRDLGASRSRTLALSLPCCLAAVILLGSSPAVAQDDGLRIDEVEVGFHDQFKTGTWTPLWVTLSGGKQSFQGTLVVEVPDGDGVATFTYPAPVFLEPGRSQRIALLIKPGQVPLATQLRVYAGGVGDDGRPRGRLRLRQEFPPFSYRNLEELTHTDDLFLVLGGASLSDTLLGSSNAAQERNHAVASLDSASLLPTRWYGYEGVDAVVVATADADDLALLDDARTAALAEWVRHGGRLVVSVGANWDQVSNHPIAQLLPASLAAEGPVPLLEFAGLIEFTNTKEALLPPGAIEGVPVARLQNVRGRVLVDEGPLPLIVRGSYGFGEVTLVGIDLDRAPFNRWKGRPQFWRRMLELPGDDDANQNAMTRQIGFMAMTDLASQLRHCLEEFEGVRLVSFGWVAFFIVLYILLIGPADYFFLKKVWNRLELTWITFPTMVVAVSVAAYFTAYGLKGRDLRANQIELIDVDGASNLVRGTTWFTLFSPRIDTYNLDVGPTLGTRLPGQPGPVIAWMGLPEDSLRGMYRTSGVSLLHRDYRIGLDAESLLGVPIQVWSTKSFTAQWQRSATGIIEIAGPGRLTSPGPGAVEGTFAHHLDRTLEQCVLAFDTRAYQLGDLAPGQQVTVEQAPTQRLQAALQQKVQLATRQTVGYNRTSTDPDDVLPVMMLYEEAAGFSHTGLTHRYLPTIDWSRHLRTGHAVLYGKLADAPRALSELRRDGQPLVARTKVHTYVRFLLPVDRAGAR
jgi:hypothetical protein